MNAHVITMRAVTKSFGQGETLRHVLRGVDVEFEQGKTYAITGISGTGKSTLMHLIAGLDAPTAGEVCVDGHSLTMFNKTERAIFLSSTVGLVFQSPYLISELSVQENIMLPGLIAGHERAVVAHRVQELLHKVGLADRGHDAPSVLSGGQQQRVALARALINEPAFLVADEPTGNLDATTGREIIDLLLACQREWGMGIIVTSHDPYVAQTMGAVFHLSDGLLRTQVKYS